VSHIAAALRTRSVVVSSGADVDRWAPLDRDLHRVVWHDVACRPCGHVQCPTAHECATAVTVEDVLAQVPAAMLQAPPPVEGRRMAMPGSNGAIERRLRAGPGGTSIVAMSPAGPQAVPLHNPPQAPMHG
jgi:hypothetical protein